MKKYIISWEHPSGRIKNRVIEEKTYDDARKAAFGFCLRDEDAETGSSFYAQEYTKEAAENLGLEGE